MEVHLCLNGNSGEIMKEGGVQRVVGNDEGVPE